MAEACGSAAAPQPSDVFLAHTWQQDEEGRNNHLRVNAINQELIKLGYSTWFDETRMDGDIPKMMQEGIDNTKLIIVFATKKYMEKVDTDNRADNVKLEFKYAFYSEKPLLYVAFEKYMTKTGNWKGQLQFHKGQDLFIRIDGDLDDENYLKERTSKILEHLKMKGVPPKRNKYCADCTKDYELSSIFCDKCGTKLINKTFPEGETPVIPKNWSIKSVENITKVSWCQFLPNDEFVTLDKEGKLQIYNSKTSVCRGMCKSKFPLDKKAFPTDGTITGEGLGASGKSMLAVSPDGETIAVCTGRVIHWVNAQTLERTTKFNSICKEKFGGITDIKMSGDGLLCLIGTGLHGAHVITIPKPPDNTAVQLNCNYEPAAQVFSSDIHKDNTQVVSACYHRDDFSFFVHVWNIKTGDKLVELKTNANSNVKDAKFLYNPDRVVYIQNKVIHITDAKTGSCVRQIDKCVSQCGLLAPIGAERRYIITVSEGGHLQVYDVEKDEIIRSFDKPEEHTFADDVFVAVHSSQRLVHIISNDEKLYILDML